MEVIIVVPQEGTSEHMFASTMEEIVKLVQIIDVCMEELGMPYPRPRAWCKRTFRAHV